MAYRDDDRARGLVEFHGDVAVYRDWRRSASLLHGARRRDDALLTFTLHAAGMTVSLLGRNYCLSYAVRLGKLGGLLTQKRSIIWAKLGLSTFSSFACQVRMAARKALVRSARRLFVPPSTNSCRVHYSFRRPLPILNGSIPGNH
jgi:hypothetical protein